MLSSVCCQRNGLSKIIDTSKGVEQKICCDTPLIISSRTLNTKVDKEMKLQRMSKLFWPLVLA
jgi:hypothetical protein